MDGDETASGAWEGRVEPLLSCMNEIDHLYRMSGEVALNDLKAYFCSVASNCNQWEAVAGSVVYIPISLSSYFCSVASNCNQWEAVAGSELIGPHIKKLSPAIFKDDSLTVGGEVKSKGEVLLQHLQNRCRVLYLDRLNRHPVHWGYFPRLEVWNMEEIRLAISEDRIPNGGDFGQLGTLDVAYGETHPTEARVSNGPGGSTERSCCVSVCFRSKTTRMRKPKLKKVYGKPTADMSGKETEVLVGNRCLSEDAFNTLLRLTLLVGRWNHGRQFPTAPGPCFWSSLLGEFVLFPGTIGADPMSRECVDCFVASPCCAYMAIVSEVNVTAFMLFIF
uniref:Uncharacterized protein n=1 Tax=Chenopodium quinoa TaxID=63459 RepID=A0A803MI35_CHEQI